MLARPAEASQDSLRALPFKQASSTEDDALTRSPSLSDSRRAARDGGDRGAPVPAGQRSDRSMGCAGFTGALLAVLSVVDLVRVHASQP